MLSVSSLMPQVSLLRRVCALVTLLCVLCNAGGAATLAGYGDPTDCAAPDYAGDACEDTRQRSADVVTLDELDRLSGTPYVPVARAARLWLAGAGDSQSRTDSAWWLRCPAHDPPKTIRFCSFLN